MIRNVPDARLELKVMQRERRFMDGLELRFYDMLMQLRQDEETLRAEYSLMPQAIAASEDSPPAACDFVMSSPPVTVSKRPALCMSPDRGKDVQDRLGSGSPQTPRMCALLSFDPLQELPAMPAAKRCAVGVSAVRRRNLEDASLSGSPQTPRLGSLLTWDPLQDKSAVSMFSRSLVCRPAEDTRRPASPQTPEISTFLAFDPLQEFPDKFLNVGFGAQQAVKLPHMHGELDMLPPACVALGRGFDDDYPHAVPGRFDNDFVASPLLPLV